MRRRCLPVVPEYGRGERSLLEPVALLVPLRGPGVGMAGEEGSSRRPAKPEYLPPAYLVPTYEGRSSSSSWSESEEGESEEWSSSSAPEAPVEKGGT